MTDRLAACSVTIETPCAPFAGVADLQRLVAFTLAAEGIGEPVSLGVILVDNATIHDLNRRFLAHDEPTDVITFALDSDSDGDFVQPGPRALGEIYISCERAAEQSAEWGQTPAWEVRFLVIHGLLHLLGWDDATDADRQRMLDRQEAILGDYLRITPGDA